MATVVGFIILLVLLVSFLSGMLMLYVGVGALVSQRIAKDYQVENRTHAFIAIVAACVPIFNIWVAGLVLNTVDTALTKRWSEFWGKKLY